jgi:hypothetical protein
MMYLPPGLEYGKRRVISLTGENPYEYMQAARRAQRRICKYM